MRINEIDHLFCGDLILCPKCERRQWKVIRDIPRGTRFLAEDFEPVDKGNPPRNGDALVCSTCGTGTFKLGKFCSIERDAESYNRSRNPKNGLASS